MGYGCYELNGRDQGYGVPAKCDHPDCNEDIDRGMAFACGGDPLENCRLFFCHEHRKHDVNSEAEYSDDNRHEFQVCERCADQGEDVRPFDPSPDTQEWVDHKLTDESWSKWREENPEWVAANSTTS